MTFFQVKELLHAQTLHPGKSFDHKEIRSFIVSDLMSDVLVSESEEPVILTSLPSEQVARTADMVGACGIVLVGGKTPQPGLIELAQELDLALLVTPLSAFEASWKIGRVVFEPSDENSR